MSEKNIKLAHILLVEDNEGDILLAQEAFEECKIISKIDVVRNGQEALDFLFKKAPFETVATPDLILLDINIPIFSGHEVLKKIKTDPMLQKIPVIILTTSSNEKDIDFAYNNHCNIYIVKPIDIQEFLNAIIKIEEFWFHLTTLPK